MNKKVITWIFLSALILGQGFTTSVQAKENKYNNVTKMNLLTDKNKLQYGENDNTTISQIPEINEDFSVGTKGRLTYTYDYTARDNKVNIGISFNKRARNFEVVIKNSAGKRIASKSFVDWKSPDGSKGVKRVSLRGNTKIDKKYTIEIINHDSVIIHGSTDILG